VVVIEREQEVQLEIQDRILRDQLMVSSVHEVAGYTKVYVAYNILTFGKLQYPATLWCWRCQISHLLL
jgi:hypothetical protein